MQGVFSLCISTDVMQNSSPWWDGRELRISS